MKSEYRLGIWVLLFGTMGPLLVNGHGRMIEPPGRNTMWRFGYRTPANYEDTENFCGGLKVQYEDNNGKCGICGDPYHQPTPRKHETGGIYARNFTVRSYQPSRTIDIYIEIVANHLGWFQFQLCPRSDYRTPETEDCFVPLELADGSGTISPLASNHTGIFFARVMLPDQVECDFCILRWHWMSGNNWGLCSDGKERMGCGPQEVYRNCADISVRAGGGIRGPYNNNYLETVLIPPYYFYHFWSKHI